MYPLDTIISVYVSPSHPLSLQDLSFVSFEAPLGLTMGPFLVTPSVEPWRRRRRRLEESKRLSRGAPRFMEAGEPNASALLKVEDAGPGGVISPSLAPSLGICRCCCCWGGAAGRLGEVLLPPPLPPVRHRRLSAASLTPPARHRRRRRRRRPWLGRPAAVSSAVSPRGSSSAHAQISMPTRCATVQWRVRKEPLSVQCEVM